MSLRYNDELLWTKSRIIYLELRRVSDWRLESQKRWRTWSLEGKAHCKNVIRIEGQTRTVRYGSYKPGPSNLGVKKRRTVGGLVNDHIKLLSLDTQAPDQGQWLIADHKVKIKQSFNSNHEISLYCQSPPTNRSTVDISSTTNEKFPLWNLKIVLIFVLVGTSQSSLIVDLLQDHSQPLDQVEWKDIVSHKEGPSDMENTWWSLDPEGGHVPY